MPVQLPWHDNEHLPLAERHEQLRRTSQAMWRLLKLRLELSDDELRYSLARVENDTQIRRVDTQLIDCGVCRHPVQSTAKCCLYCGAAPQVRFLDLTNTRHIRQ